MNVESAPNLVKGSLKMRKNESESEEAVRFFPPAAVEPDPETDYGEDFARQRLQTVSLINLAGMMERMDEQVLRIRFKITCPDVECKLSVSLLLLLADIAGGL